MINIFKSQDQEQITWKGEQLDFKVRSPDPLRIIACIPDCIAADES
jgi:hypothetical protein